MKGLSIVIAAAVMVCLAVPAWGADPPPDRDDGEDALHALLLNGGGRPATNYQSHLHHLEGMVDMLAGRGVPPGRIHIFSSDGEGGEPDLAVRDVLPEGYWMVHGTRLGRILRPRTELTDTRWPGVSLRPARKEALARWFEGAPEILAAGDTLLIFVTDHGTRNEEDPDDGSISLWNEHLSVREFGELLDRLPPGVRVVMVMSQCYSGTFGAAITRGSTVPAGDLCGFFSTSRDLPAYGCYPEGQDRDRIGHAFRFIDALARHATAVDAHREVILTDATPDVPLRTSDLYLARLLESGHAAEGGALAARADALLDRAWRDRSARDREIRLIDRIAEAYGLDSPRTLSEVEALESELPRHIDRLRTFADRWEAALVDLKEEILDSLRDQHPEWEERLGVLPSGTVEPADRIAVLTDLLPALARHAKESPVLKPRLELLRDRWVDAARGRWRLEVRLAAVRRMRFLLLGIAGRVLIEGGDRAGAGQDDPFRAERGALSALEACEEFSPGPLPGRTRTPRPEVVAFPPLEEEIAAMEEVVPSWLGIRFAGVPPDLSAARALSEGAVLVRGVFPDSPASEAGLREGDIIVGTPGEPFRTGGRLREWTMTARPGVGLTLEVIRPGAEAEEDSPWRATVTLRPFPEAIPTLP